jgi:hypothetical protein
MTQEEADYYIGTAGNAEDRGVGADGKPERGQVECDGIT